MSGFEFDYSINIGNVIALGGILLAAIVTIFKFGKFEGEIRATLEGMEKRIDNLRADVRIWLGKK